MPRFPYYSERIAIELPSGYTRPTVDTSPASIFAEVSIIASQFSGSSDICSIVYDLQYLSLVIASADRSDMTQIDHLRLSDHFYDVERRAYDLFQAKDVYCHHRLASTAVFDTLPDISSALFAACCLTAIIYSCLALREIPPQAGIFNQLVTHLTQVARKVKVSSAYCRYPKTVLWVLATGGAAARGPDRVQFVKLVNDLLQDRPVDDCDNLRDEVQHAIHMTPVYRAALMDFWDDVEEMQIMRHIC
jgi:hypothetical protein